MWICCSFPWGYKIPDLFYVTLSIHLVWTGVFCLLSPSFDLRLIIHPTRLPLKVSFTMLGFWFVWSNTRVSKIPIACAMFLHRFGFLNNLPMRPAQLESGDNGFEWSAFVGKALLHFEFRLEDVLNGLKVQHKESVMYSYLFFEEVSVWARSVSLNHSFKAGFSFCPQLGSHPSFISSIFYNQNLHNSGILGGGRSLSKEQVFLGFKFEPSRYHLVFASPPPLTQESLGDQQKCKLHLLAGDAAGIYCKSRTLRSSQGGGVKCNWPSLQVLSGRRNFIGFQDFQTFYVVLIQNHFCFRH